MGAANGEMNYNGKAKDGLMITVPVGATVQLNFVEQREWEPPAQYRGHPVRNRAAGDAPSAPAFPGAVMKNAQAGITKGQTATIRFTAAKGGKYLLICGFLGHALLGMYADFEISPTATTKPTMDVKK